MKTSALLLILCSFWSGAALAQDQVVKLWPGKIPGARLNAAYQETEQQNERGITLVRNVSEPTLSVYLPAKGKGTGAAVVICPGGGYAVLAIDHEGHQVARWLQSLGIVGIVLKNRLPHESIMENKLVGPLQDAQEAIRVVRRNARQWGIQPDRIGVLGFSAGGHLAASVSTLYAEKVYPVADGTSARPDFSILIYPVISMQEEIAAQGTKRNLLGEAPSEAMEAAFSNELRVTPDTPPAFLVHAMDDKGVPAENSIRYFLALKRHQTPAELHVYESGGHGFGLAKDKGTVADWPRACERWLAQQGYLKK